VPKTAVSKNQPSPRPPKNVNPTFINRPPRPNKQTNPRTCKLCSGSWFAPNPNLVLLDETCSYWNNRDIPLENCRNIQATYGSACGCPNAPKPVCDVCPDGDYIWKEAPQYNTFTDDYCVRMIYRMSKRTEFCDGNKNRVANMCCSKTCSSSSPSSESGSKKQKTYGKYNKKSGSEKSAKSSKKKNKNLKSEDVTSPVVADDYYDYYDYYYNYGGPYYYNDGPYYYYY
jgi:hypothetical protein